MPFGIKAWWKETMNSTVNTTRTGTDNLFLIADVREYEFIEKNLTSNSVVLSISNNPPYFFDFIDDTQIESWQKYGMVDFQVSRYWMDNYNAIETVINKSIEKNNEPLLLNKYLKMDYVAYLGGNYIEPIVEFDRFLTEYKPTCVYISRKSKIDNIISMFRNRHTFQIVEIG